MSAISATPNSGGRKAAPSVRPNTTGYSDRPYERNLTESGRRFISVDIDASILERMDNLRGKHRRGIFLDRLLDAAFNNLGSPKEAMR